MTDVAAAMFEKDGLLLLMRRAPGEKFEGRWEFPGGKIEPGESPEECLRRELFEELGIEASIGPFFAENIYDYPGGRIRLLVYFATAPLDSLEFRVHDALVWVSPDQIHSFGVLPADVAILEKWTLSLVPQND